MRAGEPDSWRADRFVAAQGLGVGANGFSGFGPEIAGRWDRWNIALYLDSGGRRQRAADAGRRAALGGFQRLRHHRELEAVGPVPADRPTCACAAPTTPASARPTVGQQRIASIVTAFGTGAGGQTSLTQRATVQPTSPLAAPLGGRALEPEESAAYAFGVGADLGPLELTADFFAIEVEDRIAQSQSFTLSDFVAGGRCEADASCLWADRAALQAAREASGFGRNADLQRIRYYLNAFDTRTRGLDVVASLPLTLRAAGASELAFAGNWTKTEVVRHDPGAVSRKRIAQLEKGLPRVRFNAALTHAEGDWRALLRANYYGPVHLFHADDANKPLQSGAEVTWDVEFGYRPAADLELVFGADNVFDNYPDRNPYAGEHGSKYPEYGPMGTAGGFYYLKARYEF